MSATPIAEADYVNYCDTFMGFCIECKEWTRESTEPDAQEYKCPKCGEFSVVGAEDALMMNYVEIAYEAT